MHAHDAPDAGILWLLSGVTSVVHDVAQRGSRGSSSEDKSRGLVHFGASLEMGAPATERPADRFDRVAFSSSPLFLTKRNMSTIAFCHLSALRVKTRGRGVGAPARYAVVDKANLAGAQPKCHRLHAAGPTTQAPIAISCPRPPHCQTPCAVCAHVCQAVSG